MGGGRVDSLNALTLEGKGEHTDGGRSQRRQWVGQAQRKRKRNSIWVGIVIDILGAVETLKNRAVRNGSCRE